MDRNTITGLVLIVFVMVAWAYFSMPSEKERQQRRAKARQDSIAAAQADSQQVAQQGAAPDSSDTTGSYGTGAKTVPQKSQKKTESAEQMGIFGKASQPDTTYAIVETPLYKAKFTNLGAGPSQIILKDYKTWDGHPVHIMADSSRSAYSMGFLTSGNYNVETNQLLFKQLTSGGKVSLKKDDTKKLKYALPISDSKEIIYTYTFHGDSHQIDLNVQFSGLQKNIIGGAVDFGWTSPLNLTEKNHSTERSYVKAYAYTGGELEELKLDEDKDHHKKHFNGSIRWVATRTEFFTQIIKTNNDTQSALLIGNKKSKNGSKSVGDNYQSFITTNLSSQGGASYKLYIGPKNYSALTNFDATTYSMVKIGYSWLRWMSEPIVKYIVIPYFKFVDGYIGVGLAIILFAILIKLVLYPLTRKSFRSMAAMKELQPKMNDIKEKYSDDAEKQQKATMKLYKDHGVNPLGGCLPQLLQLPILITLWRFFHNSILIRQQHFLWAKDLSAPDYIVHLPFSIPFLGSQLGGFVLLMAAAMVVQTQIRGGMGGGMGGTGGSGGGPNMKFMSYIFPFFLLFIFNQYAAGLSLYYFVYNVVSIAQQLIIYRQMDKEKDLADVQA